MRSFRNLFIAAQIITLLVAAGAVQAQTGSPLSSDISYTVSMPKPWTHLLEVEVQLKVAANLQVPNETELVMPVWTPGSYMVREFARHVQDFSATSASGQTLDWEKTDKNSWRVKTNGARAWRAKYRVYANELSVRTNELNSDHAFWNNAALLMYPEGHLKSSSTLNVIPYGNWKVASGLPGVAGKPNSFRAENFDVLYDSPVEVSNFKELSFQAGGVPHRIVIDGEGNYDPDRLRSEVRKIVAAEISMFGSAPYHDYTFILHLRSNTGGGLEHLNSTALGFRRFGFADEGGYRRFQSLVSHEFFHLWNVKRLRPDALGPFDYNQENYTRLLWVAEGVTEYYANLILRRAGLMSSEDYLSHLSRQMEDLQNTPGREVMSVEESSFDAWIKFYRADENSINSQISYYDKGELLGMLLDLEIRRRSDNRKSLDDVMRFLYTEFFQKDRNYTPADFQKACELMAGGSLEEFFARYVRGRDDLVPAYQQILAGAGLRLEQAGVEVGKPGRTPMPTKAFLGADLEQEGDHLMVSAVLSGTPAYEQGLNAKDEIVALDGARVNKESFDSMIAARHPGDKIRLTVFRFDDLRTLEIRLASRIDASYRIVPLPQTTPLQRRIYQSWLGETPR